jgi:hypothetical protein
VWHESELTRTHYLRSIVTGPSCWFEEASARSRRMTYVVHPRGSRLLRGCLGRRARGRDRNRSHRKRLLQLWVV